MKTKAMTLWHEALVESIVKTLATLRADGVVGISQSNLFALVKFPPGGPVVGPNARWNASQAFADALPRVLVRSGVEIYR